MGDEARICMSPRANLTISKFRKKAQQFIIITYIIRTHDKHFSGDSLLSWLKAYGKRWTCQVKINFKAFRK